MSKLYDPNEYAPQTNLFGDDETPKPPVERRGKSIMNNLTASPGDIARIISQTMILRKQEPIKTDEELIDRIDDYFMWCAQNAVVPTWEGMGLACGVSRITMWNWSQGLFCDQNRRSIVCAAKDALASIDAQLAINGKYNPVLYIFRGKNFYAMSDQQEVVLTPNNPLGNKLSESEIDQRLIDGFISDDDTEK